MNLKSPKHQTPYETSNTNPRNGFATPVLSMSSTEGSFKRMVCSWRLNGLWFLIACSGLQATTSFVYPIPRKYDSSFSTMQEITVTRLCDHNPTETASSASVEKDLRDSYTTVPKPKLLAIDVISIFMAAQLMRLLDVNNDPVFDSPTTLINQSLPCLRH